MFKRIAAIAFIFLCTSIAWAILGATVFSRTYDTNNHLKGEVSSSWGTSQEQTAPTAGYNVITPRIETTTEAGKQVERTIDESVWHVLPLDKSRVNATLHLDYRKKGLLWYSTYQVQFAGEYQFTNPSDQPQSVSFNLPLPAQQAVYDNLIFAIDGTTVPSTSGDKLVYATSYLKPHQTVALKVSYHSQGLDSWAYNFGNGVAQVKDFQLHLATNVPTYDLLENTLSPTSERLEPSGWELDWDYTNLVSGFRIGVAMPQKLQPGPLTGRMSFFAPVSLLFFFFVIFILTTLRGIDLHPMNYFFLACAFFSFHLLMAYLADVVPIHAAFVICSCVSIFLLVSYLRIVAGMRSTAFEAGAAQFLYLVLFSYAFFFDGFTGLAITIGAILTLFIAMQTTARVQWSQKFAAAPTTR
jgi:inner membrane protein involved in colicin E2 resistance